MELEQLKDQWALMSAELNMKEKPTEMEIIQMTKSGFKKKTRTLKISEIIGTFVCLLVFLLILNGLEKFESWYMVMCAIVSLLILILLPILSLIALYGVYNIDVSLKNYKQTLSDYNRHRMFFIKIQKVSLCLGALLFVVILPVIGLLINGKDLFKSSAIWYTYSVGFPFLYYFATWVFKKYNRSLQNAQVLLEELEMQ